MAALEPVRFDGSFDKTNVAGTVTSDTRTATKPVASTGSISFRNFNVTGSVNQSYSFNGGGFVSFAESDAITVANGDTLAIRITLAASGESLTFDLYDDATNSLIEQVTLAAS